VADPENARCRLRPPSSTAPGSPQNRSPDFGRTLKFHRWVPAWRAAAKAARNPPASQATARLAPDGAAATRTTSTAVRTAAAAMARCLDGKRSNGLSGGWRCTTSFSSLLTTSVVGTAVTAKAIASRRLAGQARPALAGTTATATRISTSVTTPASRPAWP
jgi:hypothetical protein